MPEPLIRRAGSADAQILAAIGAQTFVETFGHLYPPDDLASFLAEAYGLERTRADLADPQKAAWLVEAGGQAIGYALAGPCGLPHAEVTPQCGELKRIYMRKDAQGGGLGLRLFGEIMAWLEAQGRRTVWLGVWSENHGAQRFYARQGFAKVGEYGFAVGSVVDHEYILRRDGNSFAGGTAKSASNEHNLA
ncbi:GNAT family N-acetyltransferase [Phenylobacterium sp.]|uniref:GNAT family N-acetyltransferase n=1 Tax=Phenylobacterium sp. TaxID=1871053 RepID=UPI002CFDBBE8|nr:GNAT family N-acetyltransferase [Phenylobacterium sp.]HLZ73693.1 GNAT family N-acetyltransferase [Phenylobacterium sp.]